METCLGKKEKKKKGKTPHPQIKESVRVMEKLHVTCSTEAGGEMGENGWEHAIWVTAS